MADNLNDEETGTEDQHEDAGEESGSGSDSGESTESKRERFLKRFEKEDRAAIDREDGAGDDDEEDEGTGSSDDSDDTDEDTDSDRGSDADESDEDDEEGDDADTDEDEDPDESDDDADADEAEGEGEDDASDETKAALARNGAKLTLDEIPKKYRGIIEQKIKSIDAAFTRTNMEATSFRTERRQLQAEERYRTENPDLFIADLLRKGGADLFTKVNKQLLAIDPTGEGNTEESVKDAESVLDERIERRREKAAAAIDAKDRETQEILDRGDQIESTARKETARLGVPFNSTVEKLLEAEIMKKDAKDRGKGLTDDEIKTVIRDFSKDYNGTKRAVVREASKRSVQRQTEERKAPQHTRRPAPGTNSPGARRTAKDKVDHNDAESRQRAMMKTAKRVMPRA